MIISSSLILNTRYYQYLQIEKRSSESIFVLKVKNYRLITVHSTLLDYTFVILPLQSYIIHLILEQ